jgi:hypothetical protein
MLDISDSFSDRIIREAFSLPCFHNMSLLFESWLLLFDFAGKLTGSETVVESASCYIMVKRHFFPGQRRPGTLLRSFFPQLKRWRYISSNDLSSSTGPKLWSLNTAIFDHSYASYDRVILACETPCSRFERMLCCLQSYLKQCEAGTYS